MEDNQRWNIWVIEVPKEEKQTKYYKLYDSRKLFWNRMCETIYWKRYLAIYKYQLWMINTNAHSSRITRLSGEGKIRGKEKGRGTRKEGVDRDIEKYYMTIVVT